jgi:hypothetical protein
LIRSSKNFIKVKSSHDGFYDKLIAIKTIYGLIWETSGLINICMGKILLLLMILVVVTVTAAGYKIFLAIVSNLSAGDVFGKLVFGLFVLKQ